MENKAHVECGNPDAVDDVSPFTIFSELGVNVNVVPYWSLLPFQPRPLSIERDVWDIVVPKATVYQVHSKDRGEKG